MVNTDLPLMKSEDKCFIVLFPFKYCQKHSHTSLLIISEMLINTSFINTSNSSSDFLNIFFIFLKRNSLIAFYSLFLIFAVDDSKYIFAALSSDSFYLFENICK